MIRKQTRMAMVFLLAVVLALVLALPASAQVTKVEFTTHSYLAAPPSFESMWWSADVFHIGGLTMVVHDVSDYAPLCGTTTIHADVIGSPDPVLPTWMNSHGTWRTVTATGDVWEGTETSRTAGGIEYYRLEGRGVAGSVTGFHMNCTGIAPLHGVVTMTGFVIERTGD